MQLHADWAVTMGCGDVCPYVPTTVDDWDIPDPAGRPIDEVREIRDMIDERVHELATEKIDAIRLDATSHRWRLAKLLPQLIEEFGDTRPPGGDPRLRGQDPRRLRRRPDPQPHLHARAQTHPRLPTQRHCDVLEIQR